MSLTLSLLAANDHNIHANDIGIKIDAHQSFISVQNFKCVSSLFDEKLYKPYISQTFNNTIPTCFRMVLVLNTILLQMILSHFV